MFKSSEILVFNVFPVGHEFHGDRSRQPSSYQVLQRLDREGLSELVTAISFDDIMRALQKEIPNNNVSVSVDELLSEPWEDRLPPDSLAEMLEFSKKTWVMVKEEISGMMSLFLGFDTPEDIQKGLQAAAGTVRIDRGVSNKDQKICAQEVKLAGGYKGPQKFFPLAVAYNCSQGMCVSGVLVGLPESDLEELLTAGGVRSLVKKDISQSPSIFLALESPEKVLSGLGLPLPTPFKKSYQDTPYAGIITEAMLPRQVPYGSLRFVDSYQGASEEHFPKLAELITNGQFNDLDNPEEVLAAAFDSTLKKAREDMRSTEKLLGVRVDRSIPGRFTVSIPRVGIEFSVPQNFWGIFEASTLIDLTNPLNLPPEN